MNQDSSQNYSTGYNKDEVYLKRIYASLKTNSQPIWVLVLIISVLIGVDIFLNGWVGWNELFLRSLSAALLLSIAYLIRPNLPAGLFKDELLPDNYAHAIQLMKNYYRITFLKLFKLVLSYSLMYFALRLLLRTDGIITIKDFLSFRWFSVSEPALVVFAFMFIYTLVQYYSRYSRLKKLEHIYR
jgi:hypothetical protein